MLDYIWPPETNALLVGMVIGLVISLMYFI